MDAQRRRHHKQQRRLGRQFNTGKITVLAELSALVVPLYPRPVVEPLQGQMDILMRLELEHSQPALAGGGQHIDHGAVAGGEGGHLRIHMPRVEAGIKTRQIGDEFRFQPALRLHAPKRVGHAASGMAAVAQQANGGGKVCFVGLGQQRFVLAGAEAELLFLLEAGRVGRAAHAGEGQPMQAESDLGGAADVDLELGLGCQCTHAGDGGGEAVNRGRTVRAADQSRGDVAAVGMVELFSGFVALIQLEQAILGGRRIQMREPRADDRRSSLGKKEQYAFDRVLRGILFAAMIEPQQAGGEGGVDGRLLFPGAGSNRYPDTAAFLEKTPRMHRAEAVFQVGGIAHAVDGIVRKRPLEHVAHQPLVSSARGLLRRRRAPVALAGDLQHTWFRPAEALHRQAQGAVPGLRLHDAAHGIALLGPEMQQALAMLRGDGIARRAQVEDQLAIFDHHGIGRVGEEVGDAAGQALRSHGA